MLDRVCPARLGSLVIVIGIHTGAILIRRVRRAPTLTRTQRPARGQSDHRAIHRKLGGRVPINRVNHCISDRPNMPTRHSNLHAPAIGPS